jgi:hypothetical protein
MNVVILVNLTSLPLQRKGLSCLREQVFFQMFEKKVQELMFQVRHSLYH